MKAKELIAVDIGNSAIKAGWLSANDGTLQQARVAITDPAWFEKLCQAVPANPTGSQRGRRWVIASVNRPLCRQLQENLARDFPEDAWHQVTHQDIDLSVDVRHPDRVGIDRLLGASSAARLTVDRSVIVVDAGSAVTVDLVLDGCFCGGAILPGARLQVAALTKGTDQLPDVALDVQSQLELPGKDTQEAIRGGVLMGLAGAIERLCETYQEYSSRHLPVVITGGDASLLARCLRIEVVEQDEAVLSAILRIAASLQLK